ncbi:MAG: DUF115 domain-containing protein [Treponema sp.]|nr:DUF115 domain-containing protein [Treponema sp.]
MDRRYVFLESKSGDKVPALITQSGNTPLHSMVDPKREAQRLVSTITDDTGFLIILGLGGGFIPDAALANTAAQVIVMDFNITELLSAIDYSKLTRNARFTLIADPSPQEIKCFIRDRYNPALCGGIKVIPLRTRTDADREKFSAAVCAIEEAIENAGADYSVQAHFGKRWFSNIVRNIKEIKAPQENIFFNEQPNEAAIAAAGPSLDLQIPALKECKSRRAFIICSDTALPVLLHHDIEPDTVVSIDCQHISYYHFMNCKMNDIPLFLDIASPPLLGSFSQSPVFFTSDHPLAQYISEYWQPLPRLDTSGGNVTYACLSLAENIGAKNIILFGADFSYIRSRTYAKGTYIYPFFEKKQNRLSPLEALSSAFLYRSPFLPREKTDPEQEYYETSQLRFYRKKLEEKAAVMEAFITFAQGKGAPINIYNEKKTGKTPKRTEQLMSGGVQNKIIDSEKFLEQYRDDIKALPDADNEDYLQKLHIKDRKIFITLLPYTAFLKHRNPALKTKDLIEDAKRLSVQEIDRVLQTTC